MEKFIQRAVIDLWRHGKTGEPHQFMTLDLDLGFAVSLGFGDTIWIISDNSVDDYPYLRINKAQLSEINDGWFMVRSRTISGHGVLSVGAYEIHDFQLAEHLRNV